MTDQSSVPGQFIPGSAVPGALSTTTPGAGWPDYYLFNFNPNPSVEVDLTGYASVALATLAQDADGAYDGQYSLEVRTPGLVAGEGVLTPSSTILGDTVGSAVVQLYGESGTLQIMALSNPGGSVLGQTTITLDGTEWVTVNLSSLAMVAGNSFYLAILTTTPQNLTFYVDAVAYYPTSPAASFIDGDSQNALWTGTPGLSTSYQQYQNPIQLSGGMHLDGSITVIATGEIFRVDVGPNGNVIPIELDMDMSGDVFIGIAGQEESGGGSITEINVYSPPGGLDDFAVWETSTDVDPAHVLIGANNAGVASGTGGSWARAFAQFSPPKQTIAPSTGEALWQSAKFMASGFQFASVPAGDAQNLTDVQAEVTPVGSSTAAPSAYALPRQIRTIVKPTQINLVPNPSFEVSAANWVAIGSATIGQYSTISYGGSYSGLVTCGADSEGVYIIVPDLIVGDVYNVSAYVHPVTSNISDVEIVAGGEFLSTAQFGSPVYGGDTNNPGYGDGAYGGSTEGVGTALPVTDVDGNPYWYRPSTSFTATTSTMTLSFQPTLAASGTYPLEFAIDCVMVATGETTPDYGDGDSDGWVWEAGQTIGLTRSYYYERQSVALQAVESVLNQHNVFGVSSGNALQPLWATPYTQ